MTAIRLFTIGGSPAQSDQWTISTGRAPDEWGVVTPAPEATCVLVNPEWALSVRSGSDGPDEREVAQIDSSDFTDTFPLNVSIAVAPNGDTTITEEVPLWWPGRPPLCDTPEPTDSN
jgi:hypothetical protein